MYSGGHGRVSDQNLWDWIELLIVPLGLALVALLFNNWRSAREQEQAVEQQREEALRDYLDAMTRLMLDYNLRERNPEDGVSSVARTRTLAVLRQLDGKRKALVLEFLYDAGLLEANGLVVSLRHADLSGAELNGVHLPSIYLQRADLSGADLRGAYLEGANLGYANLSGADLGEATLTDVIFGYANLSGANLSGAHLSGALLIGANRTGTRFGKEPEFDYRRPHPS